MLKDACFVIQKKKNIEEKYQNQVSQGMNIDSESFVGQMIQNQIDSYLFTGDIDTLMQKLNQTQAWCELVTESNDYEKCKK